MKRILSVLVLVMLFIGFADAAYVRAFRQRGSATHDIKSRDLVAAHPNLPMGTEVTVTNLNNDKSIVVKINGRIVASGNRIIDLSEGAASALGMAAQGATSVAIEVLRDRPDTEGSPSE
jgi:rare lipoprotein A